MKRILAFFIFVAILIGECSSKNVVKLHPTPDGVDSSELLQVKINNQAAFVYQNRVFFELNNPAKVFISGDGVTLFRPQVAKPVAVRYAFKDFIVGDLFSIDGLPVSSFRTDDWEVKSKNPAFLN